MKPLLLLLVVLLLSGCQTTGNYCDLAFGISWSKKDTRITRVQIIRHNAIYESQNCERAIRARVTNKK